MGSRESRSLNQSNRRDLRPGRETNASGGQSLRKIPDSKSDPIESVVMLDEPTAAVESLVSSHFNDDAVVGGELVSAHTEWVTEVTPIEYSGANDAPAGNPGRPVASVVIPDRSRELAELQQQLGSKDELISALVGELEQVVEQLDRMQRSGSTRSSGSSGGGASPTGIFDEHHQVLGDLQRVVQQWEALQASSVLGRIEAEVGELRSMIARGAGFPTADNAHRHEAAASDSQLDEVLARLATDRQDRCVSEMQSNGASWEAIKRQMMGHDEPTATTAPDAIEVGEGEEQVDQFDEVEISAIVVPRPVELDVATLGELKQAYVEREACIVQLIRMLRSRRTVSLPDNWDDIVEVPEEQKARVDLLATRLEEQVRLAEVEMSLERARLSRERTQLQAEQEKLEKHLRRLGLTTLDELESVAVDNGSSSDRRWMRFLGVNRRG